MTISTDGTNHFLGSSYRGSSTLAVTRAEIDQFLTTVLGTDNFTTSTNKEVIDWRPNIAEEPFISNISNLSNLVHPGVGYPSNYARFSSSYALLLPSTSNFITRINTNNFNSAVNNEIFSRNTANITVNSDLTTNSWVTATDRSIATFTWKESINHYLFVWSGVTVDNSPGFDTYPNNCCSFVVVNDGTTYDAVGIRAANSNSSTGQLVLTTGDAQYPIVCNDAQTPSGDWASDFWLVDDDTGSGNPASGRCQNLLIAEGTSFSIGSLHSLNTANQEPGSNLYMCVAEWGSKFILMRIQV